MSTHVVGFRPKDAKWEKMKNAWDACIAVDAEIPDEVDRFFGGEDPGDKPGMEIDISQAVKDWSGTAEEGYEIDLTNLPEGCQIIRVYNSW